MVHGDFTRWNTAVSMWPADGSSYGEGSGGRSPQKRNRSSRARRSLGIGIVAWELYGQLVAGAMDIDLVERQVPKLQLATFERATRDGADR